MYKVEIKGFKTKETANEFIRWYSGQGEQDFDFWAECRRLEGNNIQEEVYSKALPMKVIEECLDE